MIIKRARSRTLSGYYETHHIIPRCLGGDDNPDNLAVLTAREHFICHLLLPKMLQGEPKYKMLHAYFMMSGRKIYNAKKYEIYKKEYSTLLSTQMSGKGNPMYGVNRSGEFNTFYGKKHTKETREKISQRQKKRYLERPESFKTYERTDEHRTAISQARRNTANVYNFIHKDGSTFSGSIRQLSELVSSHPAEPWKLVKGQYKTHKGWRLAN
jgi:hypothetical protein